jgi:hypothetical protein
MGVQIRPLSWRPAACLLAVVLGIVGATACGGSRPSENSPASQPSHPAGASPSPASLPVARRVPRLLRAKFALFRSPPEGLPISVTLALSGISPYGANWRLAQALPGAPWPAWLIPGRGYVCLMQQETPRSGIGQTCALTQDVLESGLSITTLPADPSSQAEPFPSKPSEPAQRVVMGVVPDGTRAVRVHTPRSDSAWSPVSQNVFALRDKALDPPETVTPIR